MIVVSVPERLTAPTPPVCWNDPEIDVEIEETKVTAPLLATV